VVVSGDVCSCDDDSGRSISRSGSSGVGGAGSSISSGRPGTCRTIEQHTYIHFFSSLYTIIHTLCMCLCMSVEQPWLGCLALQSM
jgi:hypothetical protein